MQDGDSGMGGVALALVLSLCLVAFSATSNAAPLAFGQTVADELERELEVRRWALFPSRFSGELQSASAATRWNERARALDALTRDLEAGGQPIGLHWDQFERGLGDAHLSVRTRALELGAALAPHVSNRPTGPSGAVTEVLLSDEHMQAAAEAAFAPTRLALVHLLGAMPAESLSPQALVLLKQLIWDGDDRVGKDALIALAHVAEVLSEERIHGSNLLSGLTRVQQALLLHCWFRAPFPESVTDRPGWAALDGASARPGLWEALRLARFGQLGSVEEFGEALGRAATWTSQERELLRFAARRWNPDARDVFFKALIAASKADPKGETQADLALIVAESGPLESILITALGLPPADWPLEARVSLVGEVAPHVRNWKAEGLPELVATALDPSSPRDLRLVLLEALDVGLEEGADESAGTLLALCLGDPDRHISARAFYSLAGVSGGARQGAALARAWLQVDDELRIHRLERMSRAQPIPALRAPLLSFASEPDARRAAAIELLAQFRGDAEIRLSFEAWLLEELDLVQAGGPLALRARGRAAQLVRGLGRVDPASSVELLVAVLERIHGKEDDIAKVAVSALAASPEGLALLPQWLGNNIGRRARVEAAILLLTRAGGVQNGTAVLRLRADYEHLAWDLGRRVIAALGASTQPLALAFLRELALGGSVHARGAAIEVLGGLPGESATAVLESIARDDPDLDLQRMSLGLLGSRGDGAALKRFAGSFAQVQERLPAEFAQALLEDLRVALAAADAIDAAPLQDWLRDAYSESRKSLGLAFEGDQRGGADSRWRGERLLAQELARHGHLRAELDAAGNWWELDAQLLLLMARAASEESAQLAFELQRAGLIALFGEREPGPEVIDKARLSLMGMALGAEQWGVAGSLAGILLSDLVGGRTNQRAFRSALGLPDRPRGVDPAARLMSARVQSLARRALALGDRQLALGLARRAAGLVGFSAAAARQQTALEEALARSE